MPKGQDTRHDPARKVGVREINERFYPPAPKPSTGGGAGGQEPPKKKIASGGAPPPDGPNGPKGPNNPYGPQKKSDDYHSKPPKSAPNKEKPAPKKEKPQMPREDREERYRNGWYN